jgi:hypothetical protein
MLWGYVQTATIPGPSLDSSTNAGADNSGMNVFARSNTGIVGSNATRGMNLCVGSGLTIGLFPV